MKRICQFCSKDYGNICIDQHAASHCSNLSDTDIAAAKTRAKVLDVIGKLRRAKITTGK